MVEDIITVVVYIIPIQWIQEQQLHDTMDTMIMVMEEEVGEDLVEVGICIIMLH